ncbi:MAG: magnesium chelatase subunit D [Pseudomonadota bacterium]
MISALPQQDGLLTALLVAVNPDGLGGAVLRALSGPDRDAWLAELRQLLPAEAPFVKVPINVGFDRLLGGLDFAATVAGGKPVFSTGLLEAANGGVLCLAMAERITDSTAAIVTQALDTGGIRIERDGLAGKRETSFGVVALDEGLEPEEALSAGLGDRLAFHVSSDALAEMRDIDVGFTRDDVSRAQDRLMSIALPDAVLGVLVQTALAFGIDSVRAELLAAEAARTAAALLGKTRVDEEDAALGARLVFSSRATRLPAEQPPEEAPPERPENERSDSDPDNDPDSEPQLSGEMPDELVVDAVRAAIPEGLLEMLADGSANRQTASGGRSPMKTKSRRRGRPIGVKASTDLGSSRLNLLATLKAAAPWQTLRGRERAAASTPADAPRLELRREDLHVSRYQDNVETSTIFVVDASGSQAAQRLAEVKGAIELLLNDCYVRRDQVALIAFRGDAAETLLPPTRALARVKRSLASLPGGGATPLANGLDAARELASSVVRQGRVPVVVLLTDGRANVARDGAQGADAATVDALAAARLLRAEGLKALLVDTSRRPRPRARELAAAMGAHYVPLPFADAASISATVQRNVA